MGTNVSKHIATDGIGRDWAVAGEDGCLSLVIQVPTAEYNSAMVTVAAFIAAKPARPTHRPGSCHSKADL